jgi:hypothetical protein
MVTSIRQHIQNFFTICFCEGSCGELKVETKKGEGSEFKLTLPI